MTEIETLRRDPYAVYARRVLGLSALEPIDAAPGPAERGTVVHGVLDRFFREIGAGWPEDALARLLGIGAEAFEAYADRPGVQAFWRPRFEKIAAWIAEREAGRVGPVAARHAEVPGEMPVELPGGGALRLAARADRIDELAGGGLVVVDYKTGGLPSAKDVAAGLSPQLPLEAAMAEAGAFGGVPAGPVAGLEYWRLSGGAPAGEIRPAAPGDPGELARRTLEGLRELLAYYASPDAVWRACPDPDAAPRFSDYRHLERLEERRGGEGPE